MENPKKRAPRGRPPTITRKKITDAGIQITLPNITFVGLAAALGVSHMALYKHVPSLDTLKHLVAEEIFTRWEIPPIRDVKHEELKDYLIRFTLSVRNFVKTHPGITTYVIRRLAATQPMLDKITEHQQHIAHAYELSNDQARWLLATVTFNCLAVADTIYSVFQQETTTHPHGMTEQEAEMEMELDQGIQALIVGAIAMLENAVVLPRLTGVLDISSLAAAHEYEIPQPCTQINRWLSEIEAFMTAKKDFVLIYEQLPCAVESTNVIGHSKTTQWLSAHRESFNAHCHGIIFRCDSSCAKQTLQHTLESLEKIYCVPVRIACTPGEVATQTEQLKTISVSINPLS